MQIEPNLYRPDMTDAGLSAAVSVIAHDDSVKLVKATSLQNDR
jgi:hypothetical protein